ncbi:undecaprenyl-diphosphate phosphatase [Oryzomonas sagensis]|uniref:Undecaprenyl-diphosphatase n=1 Tax=Oryzomonas sagensis TaxID=2603857 RepID=A0ABQ6TR59_9BACT|nr:undecaprenyl-diphosphate phosphatase [Oryzomonas sagensis]KAB0671437.1 undecaprenyl-diphosphate phosphatase [Oryzomonas sagensis]
MTIVHILILAAVQGAAELLPVSSSAHVIVIAKLMGLDPTTPEMTLLLVMLHTGTMFAVICYFWKSWKSGFFASRRQFMASLKLITLATILTGAVGLALKALIERFALGNVPHAEIELLFGNLGLISAALAAAGLLIIIAGLRGTPPVKPREIGTGESILIGMVQGLCLPFRGFSRSGATISVGLLLGVARVKAEEFSFALAVVLTPPVIAREILRLLKAHELATSGADLMGLFLPGVVGMMSSFLAGLLALRWLSDWLEKGRWHFFGYYCLGASLVVFIFHGIGV